MFRKYYIETHAMWGAHATTGRKHTGQDRNACSSVSFRTAMRTARTV